MPTATKTFDYLLADLTPRQREVIERRFGLTANEETYTLAALGERYGVTRERIRQIEAGILSSLRRRINADSTCNLILNQGRRCLAKQGGVAPIDELLAACALAAEKLTRNHMAVLLEATQAFHEHQGDEKFKPFYYLDAASLKNASDSIARFIKNLKGKKADVLAGGYGAAFAAFARESRLDAKILATYVSISQQIEVNPYGDSGLSEWPEIMPKTIRDRIYLVLKKRVEPLHFMDIAHAINKAGFGGRKALSPTVHNELIKDERFVLVGRGIYGLAEHGYRVGTAKDIIRDVLKKQGPMKFRDLTLAIQKDRMFKPNTILANLQQKSLFERLEDGRYRVREA